MIRIVPYPPSINGVRLTVRESDLIFALVDGRMHSKDELADKLCFSGAADGISDHAMNHHVRSINAKLRQVGLVIETIYGRGLRLSLVNPSTQSEAA